jgi:hypothetical protein
MADGCACAGVAFALEAGAAAAGGDDPAGAFCAAAGVSPAAAKAIAHPISLIFTPGDGIWSW